MADYTNAPLRHLGIGTPHKLREPCPTRHGAAPWAPGRGNRMTTSGTEPATFRTEGQCATTWPPRAPLLFLLFVLSSDSPSLFETIKTDLKN